ncbi:hypothetical protein ASZ90_015583 [hydrocarbon metagenome]|uniref:Uncharacterized protein n=1 Tax=hydrocarbon metagenome TaxID=938273 RepID=A0A0W8F1J6_9ZZZZ
MPNVDRSGHFLPEVPGLVSECLLLSPAIFRAQAPGQVMDTIQFRRE